VIGVSDVRVDINGGKGSFGLAGAHAVDRALRLLILIADAGGVVSASDLSVAAGLPLPTTHRLLQALRGRGFVRQSFDRRYAIGGELIRLGYVGRSLLGGIALPHLERVVAATKESANLATIDGRFVVYLAQFQAPRSMRMFTEPGSRVPAHGTAVGKAMLAGMSDESVRQRIGGHLERLTNRTIIDIDSLLTELEAVRKLGYALDEGENEEGVCCVAVPVRTSSEAYAISVSGPASRMGKGAMDRAIHALKEASQALASDLLCKTV
jgi:IclR family acetate operon transcriptional repressor